MPGQQFNQQHRVIPPAHNTMYGGMTGPGPGQGPFRSGATTGTGTAGVRATISPATSSATFSTTATPTAARVAVASATVSTSAASRNAPRALSAQSTQLASRPVQKIVQVQTVQQAAFKVLSLQEEQDTIRKCEENIRQGQFNVTNQKIKPLIMQYRNKNIKFHSSNIIVSRNRLFSDLGDCVSSETPEDLKSSK